MESWGSGELGSRSGDPGVVVAELLRFGRPRGAARRGALNFRCDEALLRTDCTAMAVLNESVQERPGSVSSYCGSALTEREQGDRHGPCL